MLDILNNEEILFSIAVYGYAPEFYPVLAFRKTKRAGVLEKLKEIKCPYCGKNFMEVAVSRKLELWRYGKRTKADCHEYRKCKCCFEKVGIIYLAG